MKTVFVYQGAKVEEIELPGDCAQRPSWRIPRRLPMNVSFDDVDCDPTSVITMTYDEYKQRGRMFDGRPIFCAEGYDVKEVRASLLVKDSSDAISVADRGLQREAWRFMERHHPLRVELDRWFGEYPALPWQKDRFKQAGLVNRAIRVLVAVW